MVNNKLKNAHYGHVNIVVYESNGLWIDGEGYFVKEFLYLYAEQYG